MTTPRYEKAPAETRTIGFQFAEKVAPGDIVDAYLGVTISHGASVSLGSLDGTVVTARVGGGTVGHVYAVQARVRTTQGDVLELDALIVVAIPTPTPRRKQPTEKRTLSFDFTRSLYREGAVADTLSAIVSVDGTIGTFVVGPGSRAGNVISCQASGGDAGSDYLVTIRGATGLGDLLELTASVEVREDAN